jgi:IS5 family transposase
MTGQLSFASLDFAAKKKRTKRDLFLAEMAAVVPWAKRRFGAFGGQGQAAARGTIVDATLIAASPSTKNKEGRRHPEMSQSKKGNHWYFGMKAHVGVDAKSGLV